MLTEIVIADDEVVYCGSAIDKALTENNHAMSEGRRVRWWTRRSPTSPTERPSHSWHLILSKDREAP